MTYYLYVEDREEDPRSTCFVNHEICVYDVCKTCFGLVRSTAGLKVSIYSLVDPLDRLMYGHSECYSRSMRGNVRTKG